MYYNDVQVKLPPQDVGTVTATSADSQITESASPLADPDENPLAAAIQAKRNDLKPTEVSLLYSY